MQRNKYLLMDVLNSRKLQMLGAVSCVVSFFLTSYVSCGDIEHWDQTCKKRYTNFWIYRDPYEVSQSQVMYHSSAAPASIPSQLL